MKNADSIPTRQSLLARLKDWGDQESWRDFFDTYWRLIHASALTRNWSCAQREYSGGPPGEVPRWPAGEG